MPVRYSVLDVLCQGSSLGQLVNVTKNRWIVLLLCPDCSVVRSLLACQGREHLNIRSVVLRQGQNRRRNEILFKLFQCFRFFFSKGRKLVFLFLTKKFWEHWRDSREVRHKSPNTLQGLRNKLSSVTIIDTYTREWYFYVICHYEISRFNQTAYITCSVRQKGIRINLESGTSCF